MTHIVSPTAYKCKKDFVKAVKENPSAVYLEDPAIFRPVSGFVSDILAQKDEPIYVTNHPRRTWFAQIKKTSSGVHVS